MKMRISANSDSVDPRDPFLICELFDPSPRYVEHSQRIGIPVRAVGWWVIESQPDIYRAQHARDGLAEHDYRVGAITSKEFCRIFRAQDVEIVRDPS